MKITLSNDKTSPKLGAERNLYKSEGLNQAVKSMIFHKYTEGEHAGISRIDFYGKNKTLIKVIGETGGQPNTTHEIELKKNERFVGFRSGY